MLDRTPPLMLTFDDVLLCPAASDVLPADVSLTTGLGADFPLGIPLMSSAMDTVTEAEMAICIARAGGLGVLHRNLLPDDQAAQVRQVRAEVGDDGAALRVAAAVGTSDDDLARAHGLADAGCDVLVLDTAHGHSRKVLRRVEQLRDRLDGGPLIVAGNVATAAGTRALIEAGAQAVKVGVGPGSICTTRVVAGVGVPQLSAVGLCAAEAQKHNIPVIADGGIRTSGDIVKAIAAGAQLVMVGSLLAGTDESPGRVVERDGVRFKAYRGMGSPGAMERGSADRYFQAGVARDKLVAEGVEGTVPCRGPAADLLHQLLGGLRSGMGYTGSATIEDLRQHAEFVRISSAGLAESHPHDIVVDRSGGGR